MLLAFEGTGWVGREDLSKYTGPRGGKSFVWQCAQNSTDPIKDYIPGPSVDGSNCDEILGETIDFFKKKRTLHPQLGSKGYKISLIGYSRGAYLAMCFAKYLEHEGLNVHFLGMFDAVKRDGSIAGNDKLRSYSTNSVPNNVQHCYATARSPIIGSRNWSMNYSGENWVTGGPIAGRIVLPGSHAAMGGFPNERGTRDGPNEGQGHPLQSGEFHPNKEVTAAWESGNHISKYAIKFGVLSKSIVGAKPVGYLSNRSDWYKKNLVHASKPELSRR